MCSFYHPTYIFLVLIKPKSVIILVRVKQKLYIKSNAKLNIKSRLEKISNCVYIH